MSNFSLTALLVYCVSTSKNVNPPCVLLAILTDYRAYGFVLLKRLLRCPRYSRTLFFSGGFEHQPEAIALRTSRSGIRSQQHQLIPLKQSGDGYVLQSHQHHDALHLAA